MLSQVSTCQPATVVFLSFLAQLFGYSKDNTFGFGGSKSSAFNDYSPFDSSNIRTPTSAEIYNNVDATVNGKLEARNFDYFQNTPESFYKDYNFLEDSEVTQNGL